METNTVAAGLLIVISDPMYQSAFGSGLYLACTIVAGCLGFSMVRTIVDDKEDL